MYKVDNKLFDSKAQAEFEYQKMLHKIRIVEIDMAANQERDFRGQVGLTKLEGKAKIKFDEVQRAVAELAMCHAMEKNDFVINEASLKVSCVHDEYMMICKNVFKVCMQHGLKSEHMK